MNIWIIVIHYQHTDLTARCLQSLLHFCPSTPILVVDNASHNQSLETLQKTFPQAQIKWLPLPENRGYAGGSNAGFKQVLSTGAEAILLLNNDTYIDSDICQILSKYSQKMNHQAILTAQIRDADRPDLIWYSGGQFSLYTARGWHQTTAQPSGPTGFASGCLLWLPRSVLEKLQGFDARFFLYLEDVDLCLRAIQADVPIHYVSEAVIYHQPSSSTGGRSTPLSIYYQNRNRIWLMKKHGQFKHWLVFIPFYTMGFIKRSLRALFKGDFLKWKANGYALWDGLTSKNKKRNLSV